MCPEKSNKAGEGSIRKSCKEWLREQPGEKEVGGDLITLYSSLNLCSQVTRDMTRGNGTTYLQLLSVTITAQIKYPKHLGWFVLKDTLSEKTAKSTKSIRTFL